MFSYGTETPKGGGPIFALVHTHARACKTMINGKKGKQNFLHEKEVALHGEKKSFC